MKNIKENIKNNSKQFNCWINDTCEVLIGIYNEKEKKFNWRPVVSIEDFDLLNSKFVINDDEELVEFRKGIAEGKKLLFFELNEWKPIEKSFTYLDEKIDENYIFDKLYQFIGLYKVV